MTAEKYDAFMHYLASAPPDEWRDTDGTLYLSWVPIAMYPTGEWSDSSYIPIKPGDASYGKYLDGLLPHFDYAGRQVPHAASTHHDAEAR